MSQDTGASETMLLPGRQALKNECLRSLLLGGPLAHPQSSAGVGVGGSMWCGDLGGGDGGRIHLGKPPNTRFEVENIICGGGCLGEGDFKQT